MTRRVTRKRADVAATEVRLAEALQEAQDLLAEGHWLPAQPQAVPSAEQDTLLEQCLALCASQQATVVEPIRTLHHFACTGGTLFAKCLAAMPNVQLLSEVDPLSTMQFKPGAKPRFAPTDMIAQLRQSSRGVSEDLLVDVFRSDVRVIHAHAQANGLRLVLRDHAHSHFCYGGDVPARPGLVELLPPDMPVVSAVTVRDPLASFASLTRNGWLSFRPATLDEYCRRYELFLQQHEGLPIVRYEDFLREPSASMHALCNALQLPFQEDFVHLFSAFQLSGDSGRASDNIQLRPPLSELQAIREQASQSPRAAALRQRLRYDDDPCE